MMSMDSENEEIPNSKQSKINAKREARRKRILQNANNRLEKITGREHNEELPTNNIVTDIPKTDVIYDDPEIEREVFDQNQFRNNLFSSLSQNNQEFQFNDLYFNDLSGYLNNLNNNPQANGNPFVRPNAEQYNESTRPEPSTLDKILGTKIHIVILSIIVYLLFVTGHQDYTSNNVFFYLLMWELIEMFFIKKFTVKQNNIVSIIFLLGGISRNCISVITVLYETINKILKDVAIFIFFFVITHLIYEILYVGKEFNEAIGEHLNYK